MFNIFSLLYLFAVLSFHFRNKCLQNNNLFSKVHIVDIYFLALFAFCFFLIFTISGYKKEF